jgi:hypothetical protein
VHPTRQQLDELDALLQRMLDLPVHQVDEATPSESVETRTPEFSPPVSYKTPIVEPARSLEPRVVAAELPHTAELPPPPLVPTLRPAPSPPAPAAREPGPDDWIRLASTWQPSAQTWQPLAQSWQQAARSPASAAPAPAPVAPPPLPQPIAPSLAERAMALAERAMAFAPAPAVNAQPEAPAQTEHPVSEPELHDLVFPASGPREATPARQSNAEEPQVYSVWEWPVVAVNWVFDVITLPLGPLGAGMRSRIGRNSLAVVGMACLVAAAVMVAMDWIGWIW